MRIVSSLSVLVLAWVMTASVAQAAPSIRFLHTGVDSVSSDGELLVSGNVFGAGDMDHADLVYRVDGGEWNRRKLEYEGSGEYAFRVPSVVLTGDTLEYYVEAFDWFGDTVDVFASREKPQRVQIIKAATPEPVAPIVVEEKPVAPPPPPPPPPVVEEPVKADEPAVEPVEAAEISAGEILPPPAPGAVVTVITAEDIRALHLRRLADLMKFVPGFETSRDVQGFWRVSARGRQGDAQILVMLDGQRLNNPYDGRVPWELSLDDVERIEITRGPGADRYGSGAVAAVVHLIGRKDVEVGAVISAGSFSTFEGSTRGGVKFGDVTIRSSVGATTRDGYAGVVERDALTVDSENVAGETDDHRSGFDASLRAEYRPDDSNGPSVAASFRAWREARGALVGLESVMSPESALSWMAMQGELSGEVSLGPVRMQARLYADHHATDRFHVLFPPSWKNGAQDYPGGVKQQTEAAILSTGLEVVGNLSLAAAHRLTFGVQAERQALSSFLFRTNVDGNAPSEFLEPANVDFPQKTSPDATRLTGGVFVQDVWSPISVLTLTGALRADFVSGFGLALSPRLALAVRLADPVVATLVAARGFRTPTFEEYLSILPVNSSLNGGQAYGFDAANPLQSMTVTSVDAGVEYTTALDAGRATVRGGFFFNLYENPIEAVATNKLVNNEGGVRVVGLEAEARYDWATLGGATFANVSWAQARDLGVDENAPEFSLLTDVPQLRGNLGVIVPIGSFASVGFNAQVGSERRNNTRTMTEAARPFRIPAYGLLGASLRTREVLGVELQASVFNLTDLGYVDDVPRPDQLPGLLPREGVHALVSLRGKL